MKTHAEYMRLWREKHPEHDRDYMRLWREKNRERIKESRRSYYAKNKEKEMATAVEWRQKNPDRAILIMKAASANRRYPGGRHLTVYDIEVVIENSNRTCRWCGKTGLQDRDLTLEHLQRNNEIESLTIACLSCNAARHALKGRVVTDEERAEANAEYKRQYYQKNKESLLAKNRLRVERNRENVREYHRQYYLKHKGDP